MKNVMEKNLINALKGTKREIALEQSMDSLTETMRELFLVEKETGRKGLPQRVFLSFSDALQCAMKLAEEQTCGQGICMKGGRSMNESEQKKKLRELFDHLSKEERIYMMGVAEGIYIMEKTSKIVGANQGAAERAGARGGEDA